MAELDRLDRRHGLGAMPTGRAPRRVRSTSSGGSRQLWLSLLIASSFVFAIVVVAPTSELAAARRLMGLGADRQAPAPAVPSGPGRYEFLQTQPQTGEPVGYDPCRAIEVEVNPDHAPKGYERLVDTAIEHTEGATGLRFERVGNTLRRPSGERPGRRTPVLVAWATSDEDPDLAGDVAGIGGSTAVDVGFGRREYLTGSVVLDATVFDDVRGDEYAPAQAIVDHEFGHLVGLGHVDDPGELMNSENVGRTTYGPGDLKGLARIGNIPCD